MMRRLLVVTVVLLVCTAVASAAQRGRRTTHTVTIQGMQFTPASLTIRRGDTVLWVNKDIVAHTATSEAAGLFNSRVIPPDKSWKRTFPKRGDFPYFCTYHPTMNARVRVQ
jgi:plastocyanin